MGGNAHNVGASGNITNVGHLEVSQGQLSSRFSYGHRFQYRYTISQAWEICVSEAAARLGTTAETRSAIKLKDDGYMSVEAVALRWRKNW